MRRRRWRCPCCASVKWFGEQTDKSLERARLEFLQGYSVGTPGRAGGGLEFESLDDEEAMAYPECAALVVSMVERLPELAERLATLASTIA